MAGIRAWLARHRTLVEAVHILAGLVVVALFANLAAWAVPSAGGSIELVACCTAAAVIVMGIWPLRKAWAADRAGGAQQADSDAV